MTVSPAAAALPELALPSHYNYVGAFLTFACTLNCSYCINQLPARPRARRLLPGSAWLAALGRLRLPADLPVTLQGGEPTAHPDFYDIINGMPPAITIDLLTNLQFDVGEFMRQVPASRLQRPAPYASIRVSYHPESMVIGELLERVFILQRAGYSVGIWGILHPLHAQQVLAAQSMARARGLDFRTKEFLGEHAGRWYGTYRYRDAVTGQSVRLCRCQTSELLLAPDGRIYRCHRDMYRDERALGCLTDPEFSVHDGYQSCANYGTCHPCDVKLKHDRFQRFGHSAVAIENGTADDHNG